MCSVLHNLFSPFSNLCDPRTSGIKKIGRNVMLMCGGLHNLNNFSRFTFSYLCDPSTSGIKNLQNFINFLQAFEICTSSNTYVSNFVLILDRKDEQEERFGYILLFSLLSQLIANVCPFKCRSVSPADFIFLLCREDWD